MKNKSKVIVSVLLFVCILVGSMVIQKPQQVKAVDLDLSAEIMDAAGNSQKTFH